MRKPPTPEQKAQAAEKRERMRALSKRIAGMSEDERRALIAQCPAVITIEERALSPKNQMMLAFQLPKATIVGGFRQWLKHGRAVRKGEHGASIWIPLFAQAGDDSAAEPDEKRFGLATVFDVSQTDEVIERTEAA